MYGNEKRVKTEGRKLSVSVNVSVSLRMDVRSILSAADCALITAEAKGAHTRVAVRNVRKRTNCVFGMEEEESCLGDVKTRQKERKCMRETLRHRVSCK